MKLTHFDTRFKEGITSVILTCDPEKQYRKITRIDAKTLITVRGLKGVFQIQEVETFTNEPQGKPRSTKATKRQRENRKEASLDVVRNFSELPDCALVGVGVVAALMGCSEMSIWRYAKEGAIPKPVNISYRVTRWRVGELRAFLKSGSHA